MLTNEAVLKIFAGYLEKDEDYEVVATSKGYTVMGWDCCRRDWNTVVCCPTPEALRDALLDAYYDFAELGLTDGERSLTAAEKKKLKAECGALVQQCEKEGAL